MIFSVLSGNICNLGTVISNYCLELEDILRSSSNFDEAVETAKSVTQYSAKST